MKMWKLYAGIAAVLLLFGGGMALGWRLFRPSTVQRVVTADVILTALRDRGFLVTQTYIFNEPVTITKTSGSALKDFFFGQTITARGVMEVNMGTDLAKITADDIRIDGDTVIVTIGPATLFNDRLIGPIDVKNDQGLLKRILQSEDGYNEALVELSKQAEAAATKPELVDTATKHAQEEIARLLTFVAAGKKVDVRVRQ